MAVQTDFMAAVNQIAAERGIDVNQVVSAIAEAIKAGFLQKFPEKENVKIDVDINADQGQIAVYQVLAVVENVVDEDLEITLADAKKKDKKAVLGGEIKVDITPEGDFGRVAAQSAKQAILQKIREVEKETQLKEFTNRLGEIEYAVVQRMDGDSVIWEIGKTIAIMPATERIANEFYKSGNRHKVLIKSIDETPRGKSLIVSRASAEFLEALFMLEIPELSSESIEIKAIAREAGSRSKVAVASNVDGIDPIGSCVGQKGMRINAIMNELRFGAREEKIDIILWDDDIVKFLANAVSPAEAKKVVIVDEGEKLAKILVPDEQLSLAIGKDGQNVRLAAKLTGWKIDIASEEEEKAKIAAEKKAAKASKAKPKKEAKEKPTKKATKKAAPKKAAAKKPAAKKVAKPKAKAVKKAVKKTTKKSK